MPTGLTNIDYGTFAVDVQYPQSHIVQHNIGKLPDFILVWCDEYAFDNTGEEGANNIFLYGGKNIGTSFKRNIFNTRVANSMNVSANRGIGDITDTSFSLFPTSGTGLVSTKTYRWIAICYED